MLSNSSNDSTEWCAGGDADISHDLATCGSRGFSSRCIAPYSYYTCNNTLCHLLQQEIYAKICLWGLYSASFLNNPYIRCPIRLRIYVLVQIPLANIGGSGRSEAARASYIFTVKSVRNTQYLNGHWNWQNTVQMFVDCCSDWVSRICYWGDGHQ